MNSIVVEGIHPETTEGEVNNHFRKFGRIVLIRMTRPAQCVQLAYADREAAIRAASSPNHFIRGKLVHVKMHSNEEVKSVEPPIQYTPKTICMPPDVAIDLLWTNPPTLPPSYTLWTFMGLQPAGSPLMVHQPRAFAQPFWPPLPIQPRRRECIVVDLTEDDDEKPSPNTQPPNCPTLARPAPDAPTKSTAVVVPNDGPPSTTEQTKRTTAPLHRTKKFLEKYRRQQEEERIAHDVNLVGTGRLAQVQPNLLDVPAISIVPTHVEQPNLTGELRGGKALVLPPLLKRKNKRCIKAPSRLIY